MNANKVGLVVLCIFAAAAILVGFYFYQKQQTECDKAGGVLARNGAGYVCVQEVK